MFSVHIPTAVEAFDWDAGLTLAEILRQLADKVESDINIAPYDLNPFSDWITETRVMTAITPAIGEATKPTPVEVTYSLYHKEN